MCTRKRSTKTNGSMFQLGAQETPSSQAPLPMLHPFALRTLRPLRPSSVPVACELAGLHVHGRRVARGLPQLDAQGLNLRQLGDLDLWSGAARSACRVPTQTEAWTPKTQFWNSNHGLWIFGTGGDGTTPTKRSHTRPDPQAGEKVSDAICRSTAVCHRSQGVLLVCGVRRGGGPVGATQCGGNFRWVCLG